MQEQEAGLEAQLLTLTPSAMWDVGIPGGSLMCCSTIPALSTIFKSFFSIFLLKILCSMGLCVVMDLFFLSNLSPTTLLLCISVNPSYSDMLFNGEGPLNFA